jgi:NDP-sugar pyrophosphorylase family protein
LKMSRFKSIERVIILAGGEGKRLNPYTIVLPKPLMPVGNLPILEIIIKQLKKYQLKDITLAVGYLGNLIQTFFGDGKKFGVKIKYSFEESPLGTMGPLSLIPGLDKTFMVMNGDLLTTLDYSKLARYHLSRKTKATIAIQKRPRLPYQVSMGIYIFEPEILSFIPRNKKFDFPELMNLLLKKGEKVSVYPSSDFWLDIGRHEDYRRALEEFEKIKARLL